MAEANTRVQPAGTRAMAGAITRVTAWQEQGGGLSRRSHAPVRSRAVAAATARIQPAGIRAMAGATTRVTASREQNSLCLNRWVTAAHAQPSSSSADPALAAQGRAPTRALRLLWSGMRRGES